MNSTLGVSSRAYKVFIDELTLHLENGRKILSLSAPLAPEVCREASAAFHTIKGGAGFFGLTELMGLASILEEFFRGQVSTADQLAQIREVFSHFESVTAQLDPPQEGN